MPTSYYTDYWSFLSGLKDFKIDLKARCFVERIKEAHTVTVNRSTRHTAYNTDIETDTSLVWLRSTDDVLSKLW